MPRDGDSDASRPPPARPSTIVRLSTACRSMKREGESSAPAPDKRPKTDGIPAWKSAAQRRAAGPVAPGSKPIPEGQPNCLAGLTLVFTGELSSLSREDAVDLAKRYGAYVSIVQLTWQQSHHSSVVQDVVCRSGRWRRSEETRDDPEKQAQDAR